MTQPANAGYGVPHASRESDQRDPILPAITHRRKRAPTTGGSVAENMMYRPKQLGGSLHSLTFARPVTEAYIRAAITNTFTYLGMPQSVPVGQISPPA